MPPIRLKPVVIDRPLEGATVTVRLSVQGRVRLWLTRRLIVLAVWVSGGNLEIKD